MRLRARAVPLLAAALLAGGLAGRGEEDVQREVERGAEKARDEGEKAADKVRREGEKAAKDVQREAEKQTDGG